MSMILSKNVQKTKHEKQILISIDIVMKIYADIKR